MKAAAAGGSLLTLKFEPFPQLAQNLVCNSRKVHFLQPKRTEAPNYKEGGVITYLRSCGFELVPMIRT